MKYTSALALAAFPAGEVDAGLVIHEEDAPAFGHVVAQAGGFEPFEHAQVMFVQAFAHGQVAELVAAQIQAVEVADGQLGPVVPGVVGGG